MKITAGIITRNEATHIKACLESLKWCDELLVVDSKSTDDTVTMATQAGARVLMRDWSGFADQRNYLLSQASHPWVLMLDADERCTDSLAHALRLAMERFPNNVAFRIPRKSFYLGRWIAHGGWYPDFQTRLLKTNSARFINNLVHERVEANGPVGAISEPILHYPFSEMKVHIETNNRYSSLLAEDLQQQGQRFSMIHLLVKPAVKFVECYFIKRGFLDGFQGFFIAVSAAYSVFLKWAKLWERSRP